jgi:hypothetical protein
MSKDINQKEYPLENSAIDRGCEIELSQPKGVKLKVRGRK